MDCDEEKNKPLCGEMGIKGAPSESRDAAAVSPKSGANCVFFIFVVFRIPDAQGARINTHGLLARTDPRTSMARSQLFPGGSAPPSGAPLSVL